MRHPEQVVAASVQQRADVLAPYGVDMRYPEEFEVVSQKRAEQAVAMAEWVKAKILTEII